MTGSHISLFAGVGMTDLAMESLGWRTIATAENNEWCRGILRKRFPDAIHYKDVRHIEGNAASDAIFQTWNGKRYAYGFTRPLLVSGGFPCQGMSPAGTGQGLKDERSGLWSEFARVIHEFRPEAVLIENSPNLRTRGLDRILCDLSDLDYDARWDCIPAASVGAPHLRDRIFIAAWPNGGADIAYSDLERPYVGVAVTAGVLDREWLESSDSGPRRFVRRFSRAGELTAGFVSEREPLRPTRRYRSAARYPTPTKSDGTGGPGTSPHRKGGKNLRTVIAEMDGPGRLNPEWVEWLMGLPLGWTDPRLDGAALPPFPGWEAEPASVLRVNREHRHRKERLMALGNGLVPQVARQAMESLYQPKGHA